MKINKTRLLISAAIATPVLLVGGYFLAKKVVWPKYKAYRAESFARSAHEFQEKGDFDNAMLFVRKVLGENPNSATSLRLAAEITEKHNEPSVLFYQQRLLDLEPNLTNRIQFLRNAVKYNSPRHIEKALSGAGAEVRDSAEFHELAAQASIQTRNTIQAKFHYMALCELRPDNGSARLDLASIRLTEKNSPETRASLRAEVKTLVADPSLRSKALLILLNDNLRHNDSTDAAVLLAQLERETDLNIVQELVYIEALRAFKPELFEAQLAKLKEKANTGEKRLQIGRYMLDLNRAPEVRDWLSGLAADDTKDVFTQVALANAYVETHDWATLESYLKNSDWKEKEFHRLALVAYAQQQSGNLVAFAETWRLALSSAGTNTVMLNSLLAQSAKWRWVEQRVEVLWRVFQINPTDVSIQQQLFAYERSQGNTAGLNRIFARLLEAQPNDAAVKNNYAYTCLLLANSTTKAATLAAEAAAAEPKNPYYATTLALSLLRSGESAKARAVLAAFNPIQLMQPEQIITHAAVLASCGAIDEAEIVLGNTDTSRLLPEEQSLANEARKTIASVRSEKIRTGEITETIAANRATSGKGFLPLLPEALRANTPLSMQLADSLYSRDDFEALSKEASSGQWETSEFLRYAVLAYAQRRLDQGSTSRDSWRLATGKASTRPDHQRALATLAAAWGWDDERIDLLNRILQRDSTDTAAFDEVAAAYTRNRRTADLAQLYSLALNKPGARSRFAYYSLLAGTNTSEAHVAAKAGFDQNPSDLFSARALALSLWKQNEAAAGLKLLASNATRISTEIDLSLVLGLLNEAAGNDQVAAQNLAAFVASNALPEEQVLAESLGKRLAEKRK
jgi:hypothetical protein